VLLKSRKLGLTLTTVSMVSLFPLHLLMWKFLPTLQYDRSVVWCAFYMLGFLWRFTRYDRLLISRYLSRDDHNRKIRTKKQRTDVVKYPFLDRTIKSWNLLLAGLLASFPCQLHTFRKRVKKIVTSKGIEEGIECK
jgi:hypothetical protein